jgi:hypothetical protein
MEPSRLITVVKKLAGVTRRRPGERLVLGKRARGAHGGICRGFLQDVVENLGKNRDYGVDNPGNPVENTYNMWTGMRDLLADVVSESLCELTKQSENGFWKDLSRKCSGARR